MDIGDPGDHVFKVNRVLSKLPGTPLPKVFNTLVSVHLITFTGIPAFLHSLTQFQVP